MMSISKFLVVLPFDWNDEQYAEFSNKVETTYPGVSSFQLDKHVWGVAVENGFSYTVAEALGIGEQHSGFVFPMTSMAGKYNSSFVEWYNG